MDSLLANYASSDDEDQPLPPRVAPEKPMRSNSSAGHGRDETSLPNSTAQRGGIFNSLPPPRSSIFNSLPPPKSKPFTNPIPQTEWEQPRDINGLGEKRVENLKPKPSSTLLFNLLPQPKTSSLSSCSSASKNVVRFKPPTIVNPSNGSSGDEDEDSDEDEQEIRRKKAKESISTASPTSFLSSVPAPKHSATLGTLPSASGRRLVLESNVQASTTTSFSDSVVNPDQSIEMKGSYSSLSSESEKHAYYSGNAASGADGSIGLAVESVINIGSAAGMNQVNEIYDNSISLGSESSAYNAYYGDSTLDVNGVGTTASNGSYGAVGYMDYSSNPQYDNNWNSTTALPEVPGAVEPPLYVPGKRGKKDVPPQIIEVKQDELIKNRPREDQVKLTGVAFGPAYQPASSKGKPSKLHKRKHQIGSLYFDMRQKEMELAERRAKGFLTKSQTQAKYGW